MLSARRIAPYGGFCVSFRTRRYRKKRQEKKESVFVEACLLVFNSRQLVVKKRARKGLCAQANLAVIE